MPIHANFFMKWISIHFSKNFDLFYDSKWKWTEPLSSHMHWSSCWLYFVIQLINLGSREKKNEFYLFIYTFRLRMNKWTEWYLIVWLLTKWAWFRMRRICSQHNGWYTEDLCSQFSVNGQQNCFNSQSVHKCEKYEWNGRIAICMTTDKTP